MRYLFALMKSWWPIVLGTMMMVLFFSIDDEDPAVRLADVEHQIRAELDEVEFVARARAQLSKQELSAGGAIENALQKPFLPLPDTVFVGSTVEFEQLESGLMIEQRQDLFKKATSRHPVSEIVLAHNSLLYIHMELIKTPAEELVYYSETDVFRRLNSLFSGQGVLIYVESKGDTPSNVRSLGQSFSVGHSDTWRPRLTLLETIVGEDAIELSELSDSGLPMNSRNQILPRKTFTDQSYSGELTWRIELNRSGHALSVARIQAVGFGLTLLWLMSSIMFRIWPIWRGEDSASQAEKSQATTTKGEQPVHVIPVRDPIHQADGEEATFLSSDSIQDELQEPAEPAEAAEAAEASETPEEVDGQEATETPHYRDQDVISTSESIDELDKTPLPQAPAHSATASEMQPRMTQAFSQVELDGVRRRDEAKPYWNLFEDFLRVRTDCGQSNIDITYDKFERKLLASKAQIMKELRVEDVEYHVHEKNGRAALRAVPITHT